MTIGRAVPRGSLAVALVLLCASWSAPLQAQTAPGSESLRAQVEARYQVTPISGGIGLMPRNTDRGFTLIELRGGTVAIDGEPVSGQELAARLGADADLILRLTYLDTEAQRSRLGLTAPAAVERAVPAPLEPDAPAAPAASAASESPAVETDESSTPAADRCVVRGDIVRMGGRVHVAVDEQVLGDVVVIGGSVCSLTARSEANTRAAIPLMALVERGTHQDAQASVGLRARGFGSTARRVKAAGRDLQVLTQLRDRELGLLRVDPSEHYAGPGEKGRGFF